MSFEHTMTYAQLNSVYEQEAGKIMKALGVPISEMKDMLPKLAVLIKNKSEAEKAVDAMSPDEMAQNLWDNK